LGKGKGVCYAAIEIIFSLTKPTAALVLPKGASQVLSDDVAELPFHHPMKGSGIKEVFSGKVLDRLCFICIANVS
jgi:hypothetical protein